MDPDPISGVVPYEVIDSVKYDTIAPWPIEPAGTGPSLSRITAANYGDEPTNWKAGPNGGTPGAVNVPNATPNLRPIPGGGALEGGTFQSGGSFIDADPGDSWTATVDYGDGTGVQPLSLTGHNFLLSHVYVDNNPPGPSCTYTVTVVITDSIGASATGTCSVGVGNVPPTVSISGAATSTVGVPYTLNLSAINDPGIDTISQWTINWGDGAPAQVVTGHPASTTHTYTVPGSPTITASATDEDGTYNSGNSVSVNVGPGASGASIAGRYVFYNNSSFDGGDPAPGAADDAAIATDKSALLPGQTATFANFTSYFHGLNGIMIDATGLTNAAAISATDFLFTTGTSPDPTTWTPAPDPASVSVRAVAGGANRITILWSDNAIQNTWLQVTMKADTITGLAASDIFYFGNLIGDANGNGNVTVADVAQTKSLSGQAADPTSPADFNRSGQVSVADVAIAKAYQGNSIPMFAAPAAAPPPPVPAAAPLAAEVTAAPVGTVAGAMPTPQDDAEDADALPRVGMALATPPAQLPSTPVTAKSRPRHHRAATVTAIPKTKPMSIFMRAWSWARLKP
jgi:hypothetical protein